MKIFTYFNFTVQRLLVLGMLICSVQLTTLAQTQTLISDIDDLKKAVNAAQAGDVFIIKDGTYSGNSMSLKDVKGAPNQRVVVKAESVGGVVFTEDTKFILRTCEYVTIEGITFTNSGTAIKLEGSNNIRITRNTFRLTETSSTKWVYIGGVWDQPNSSFSHHNRIDHNLFENKTEAGNCITIDGSGEKTQSQFDVIDHNYFKYNTPRAVNEKEAIRIGWSEMSESSGFTTVEFNLFEECNGDPEIVSVKSCDNIIRHNTFLKSQGTLSLRHGNRNRVEGNYFLGAGKACEGNYCSGGVRIYGEDHVIINNYFEGLKGYKWDAPITLTEGDADSGNSSLSKHFRIERAIIAYNTLVDNDHGIEIGYDNQTKYNKPARDVLFAYNLVQGSKNELIKYYNEPDNMSWVNNVMYATGTATLTSDGRTFKDSEVSLVNPNLVYDETAKVWRSTNTTPTVTHNDALLKLPEMDMEGELRTATSTVGADNFHADMNSVRYKALTPADVGPLSAHPDYDGEAAKGYLLLSTGVLIAPAEGHQDSVLITSDLDWTVTGNPDWVTVSPTSGSGSGTVYITIAENKDLVPRAVSITIASGEETVRLVKVSQEAGVLDLGGAQISVKAVTASAEQSGSGNVKENVIDGDPSTRWSAEGEQFITLELDKVQLVTYLKVLFKDGDTRTTTYQIDLSEDNESYTNVVSKRESSGTTADFEIIDIKDTQAKFVRLTGFGNSKSSWNSINEIQVWGLADDGTGGDGGTGTVDPDPDPNEEPLALSNTITGVSVYPNPVQNVIFLKGATKAITGYQLYDHAGRLIKSGQLVGGSIDFSDVPVDGMMILRLSKSNGEQLNVKVLNTL